MKSTSNNSTENLLLQLEISVADIKPVTTNHAYELGVKSIFGRNGKKRYIPFMRRTATANNMKSDVFELVSRLKPVLPLDTPLAMEIEYWYKNGSKQVPTSVINKTDVDGQHKMLIDALFEACEASSGKVNDKWIWECKLSKHLLSVNKELKAKFPEGVTIVKLYKLDRTYE